MATYKEIQTYVNDEYKCSIKTCWIADMKDQCAITTRSAPNRISKSKRVHPCPTKHKDKIMNAFRHFGMVS